MIQAMTNLNKFWILRKASPAPIVSKPNFLKNYKIEDRPTDRLTDRQHLCIKSPRRRLKIRDFYLIYKIWKYLDESSQRLKNSFSLETCLVSDLSISLKGLMQATTETTFMVLVGSKEVHPISSFFTSGVLMLAGMEEATYTVLCNNVMTTL